MNLEVQVAVKLKQRSTTSSRSRDQQQVVLNIETTCSMMLVAGHVLYT